MTYLKSFRCILHIVFQIHWLLLLFPTTLLTTIIISFTIVIIIIIGIATTAMSIIFLVTFLSFLLFFSFDINSTLSVILPRDVENGIRSPLSILEVMFVDGDLEYGQLLTKFFLWLTHI